MWNPPVIQQIRRIPKVMLHPNMSPCKTIAMNVKCLEGEDNMIWECHANAKV